MSDERAVHVCGLEGFDDWLGDVCPVCEAYRPPPSPVPSSLQEPRTRSREMADPKEAVEGVLREFNAAVEALSPEPILYGESEYRMAAEIARLRTELENAKTVLKDICEEWCGETGAKCDPRCDSYGHEEHCEYVNIADYLRRLKQELAQSHADAERWRAVRETAITQTIFPNGGSWLYTQQRVLAGIIRTPDEYADALRKESLDA